MRYTEWTKIAPVGKFLVIFLSLCSLAGCSTNPATGEQQFTALLPASQEASVGAQEHQKVEKAFGGFISGPVANYVADIGRRVAANTERSDVQYKFYVIDSPDVNAFAIPGGYIYVTRGLLALANTEADVAGVLGHEIAHITARHSAERASQGFLVGLGAAVLGAATGSSGVAQAANVGSDLLIKSYSRGQETQADELGVRYLTRAGYDPYAMASFLKSLDAQSKLDARIAGRDSQMPSYFSTHPVTAERVTQATAVAATYPKANYKVLRENHLVAVKGLIYGDSPDQGFVKNNTFYHPKIGFAFDIPSGYNVENTPSKVLAVSRDNGTVFMFDAVGDKSGRDPLSFLREVWLKNEPVDQPESITVNGMRAATAGFSGTVNGKPATIRVVAVEWQPGQFFRFQMAIPPNSPKQVVDGLKRTTYSLRRLSESEKNSLKPPHIALVPAKPGDTVASLGAQMAVPSFREEQFRVLNGLMGGEPLVTGRMYKIVSN
ncbi:MAG: M48 family metalloprotease [Alphaproteobacteria bacterium]|nr:M48 family metalloprotease [Alphaproteobacteria bacterium]